MLPKILIVDDSKAMRMRVRDMLPKGFDILDAADGAAGMEVISQHRPNLVLLDFFMPHLNGWEVLQQIETNPKLRGIPVVVMTGRKEEVMERIPDLLSFYEVIEKPFEQRVLMGAIKSAMAKIKSRPTAPFPAAPTPSTPPVVTPETPPIVPSGNATDGAELASLKAEIQGLKQQNAKMQAELDTVKKQLAQVLNFIRQRMQ